MRGALAANIHEIHRNYYLMTTTAITVVAYEETMGRQPPQLILQKADMFTQNPQTAGLDTLDGTYVFDLRVCNKTLQFNRFFWNMVCEEHRNALWENEAAAMAAAQLTGKEMALVRARDWLGIVRYGVNFFVLEKWARVVKKINLEVYAIMRGETGWELRPLCCFLGVNL
jgi:protocatechuate 4,5-dioxygenase alpha chain